MEQRLFHWQKYYSGIPRSLEIPGNKAFSISHPWKYLSNDMVRNTDLMCSPTCTVYLDIEVCKSIAGPMETDTKRKKVFYNFISQK